MLKRKVEYIRQYKSLRIISIILSIILISLVSCYQITNAQGINTIESKFDSFRKNDLQEKLFVHTDKNFYIAGEIVWFKIYDVNGATNAPFDFSKVAYVELLDKDHHPVLQTKVSLFGNGGGSLELPPSLPSGNYLFRAYTSWMKNFSPDFYFKKVITIVNTTQQGGGVSQQGVGEYDIQFLPEGGNLVAGIKSEVGFRAVDQYGRGLNFNGVLIDQHKDTVLSFRPFKFGMGHFYFTPVISEKYKAILFLDNGKTVIRDLPEIYSQGYVMHIQNEDNNKIQVTVHTNIPAMRQVYLIIQTRESVKVAQVLLLQNGVVQTEIETNKLDEGISQFTIFDSELQPVCERLYFKKVRNELKINTVTGNKQYGLRNKVSLTIQTTDEQNKPVAADMSVSVYKLDSLYGMDEGNILNYLWLTSDLRGKIQDPGYYFSNDPGTEEALENLMLTQGWRRFSWNEVMQNQTPDIKYAPELSEMVIHGKIRATMNMAAKNVLTYLAIQGKHVQVYPSQSDDQGNIYFKPNDFFGDHKIVVETDTQSGDSTDKISISNPFSSNYSKELIPPFDFNKSFAGELQSLNIWNQVQQAYYHNELRKFAKDPLDTVAFYGKPFKTYNLDDYVRYTTMEEVIREYVTEVALRRKDGHYRLLVLNNIFNHNKAAASVLFQNDPLILLDGVPVFNVDSVMVVNPLKIQKLSVVAGRYFWGPVVADGILSFTSYKGDMAGFNLDPHAVVLNYKGLQKEREFYSPAYNTESSSSNRMPDFRNVLYWSPELISDSLGKARCSFYTSDIPGDYLIEINGITQKGLAGNNRVHLVIDSF